MRTVPHNKNFHVPLPDMIYSELMGLADELRIPATKLARNAIEIWLKERKKRALHKKITSYAAEMAGTSSDLDQALENAGIDFLLDEEK